MKKEKETKLWTASDSKGVRLIEALTPVHVARHLAKPYVVAIASGKIAAELVANGVKVEVA